MSTQQYTGSCFETRKVTRDELFLPYCIDGWMICDFTSFSTVFQLYQDNGKSIMKGCVQWKSRKENLQKLTELSRRCHPRYLVGKRTALKDAIKDITSDSQVNSYFPYRWSPAILTSNIYFYLFLYLYITRITISNGSPHLNSPKNQNRRAAKGRPAIKILRSFN